MFAGLFIVKKQIINFLHYAHILKCVIILKESIRFRAVKRADLFREVNLL